ncbi:hypothetical protein AHAS_Ahas20G0175600 [Arachis hypogaea]
MSSSAAAPSNYRKPNSIPAVVKRKRNLEAEVIALSPKSLMAKNRFVSEICKKGGTRTYSCTGEGTTCRGSFVKGRSRWWWLARVERGRWTGARIVNHTFHNSYH